MISIEIRYSKEDGRDTKLVPILELINTFPSIETLNIRLISDNIPVDGFLNFLKMNRTLKHFSFKASPEAFHNIFSALYSAESVKNILLSCWHHKFENVYFTIQKANDFISMKYGFRTTGVFKYLGSNYRLLECYNVID